VAVDTEEPAAAQLRDQLAQRRLTAACLANQQHRLILRQRFQSQRRHASERRVQLHIAGRVVIRAIFIIDVTTNISVINVSIAVIYVIITVFIVNITAIYIIILVIWAVALVIKAIFNIISI
jgi:hypothetical protein